MFARVPRGTHVAFIFEFSNKSQGLLSRTSKRKSIQRRSYFCVMSASTSRHNLVTGQGRNPLWFLSSTFLTLPSSVGWTFRTQASGQWLRAVFGSTSRTISSFSMFLLSVHLGLTVRTSRYSRYQLCQNMLASARDCRSAFPSILLISFSSTPEIGGDEEIRWTKKEFGVRTVRLVPWSQVRAPGYPLLLLKAEK